jgi:ParB-like chromosome segregation protein Spo0J
MDKLPRSHLYLHNRQLEANPKNQKLTPLYQNVLKSLAKGPMINPILVIPDGTGKYAVVYGNNRFLAGCALGYKEFPVKILPNNQTETILEAAKDYKSIKI